MHRVIRPALASAALFMAAIALCVAPAPSLAQGLDPSDAARALARTAAEQGGSGATAPAPARRSVAPVIRRVALTAPSAYLTADEVMAAASGVIGRRASPGNLAALTAAIDAVYAARGIGLAQSVVTGIDPSRGIVTIRLVEARVGTVRAEAPGLDSRYVVWRLGVGGGDLADTRRIGAALERLSISDGLATEAGFAPGAAAGTTDLTVRIAPVPRWTGHVGIDNAGSPAAGRERLSFRVQRNSVTGWNDPLALDLTASRGNRAATLSYSRVVTPRGDRLRLALSGESGTATFGPLRDTRASSAQLTWTAPLRLTDRSEIALTGGLETFRERATLGGIALADQRGTAVSLSLSGIERRRGERSSQTLWAAGLTFGGFRDEVAGGGTRDHARLNLAFGHERIVPGVGYLVLRGAVQVPLSHRIPSRDRFVVTSSLAVPGYDEGLSAGAGGYWLRAQIERARPLGQGHARIDLRPYAAIAMGEAFDHGAAGWRGQGLAAAVAIGASARTSDGLRFDLQLSRPLRRVLGQGGDGGLHLNLSLARVF
jgi:hemolysin activation/secretion protein